MRPRSTCSERAATWNGTRDRQNVAFADVLLARIAVRRGRHEQALPMIEAAMEELRRLKMDAYVEFAKAVIAEAEAFSGDPFHALEIASGTLQVSDQQRPLLTRVAGIALARLGQTGSREARAQTLAWRPRASEAPNTTSPPRSTRSRRSVAPSQIFSRSETRSSVA